MQTQFDMWIVLARGQDGQYIPTACSATEEGAYDLAREAVEVAALMLSRGATAEQIAHTEAVLNSVKVVPGTISVDHAKE